MEWPDSALFSYVILPILIFLARMVDVAMGTFRIILISRGHRLVAPLLGFFEMLIWLVAIGQIMQNLTNVFCYIAYAGGFAMGNYVGMVIEAKAAMGKQVVRVMTHSDPANFIEALRDRGYGVTHIPAEGREGPVHVIFSIIARANLDSVIRAVESYHPNAFYTIEDIKSVKEGVFPENRSFVSRLLPNPPRAYRKLKARHRRGPRKGK